MQTKLTLRLEAAVIKRAKRYAKNSGKSLSQMVSEYFEHLERPRMPVKKLGPITHKLKGALLKSGVDETDYRSYQEQKYR